VRWPVSGFAPFHCCAFSLDSCVPGRGRPGLLRPRFISKKATDLLPAGHAQAGPWPWSSPRTRALGQVVEWPIRGHSLEYRQQQAEADPDVRPIGFRAN
jgi:hypothetical protein